MKMLRVVSAMLIIGGMLFVIGTSSKQTPPKTPEHRLRTIDQKQKWLDIEERRLIRQRVSRASSERSAIASAATSTTQTSTSIQTPVVKSPRTTVKPRSPKPTTTVQNTEQHTSPENPPGENSSNYDACFAAAASVKGAKVAPNVARWTYLVEQYFPAEIYKTCRVMACESSGNPGAVGPRQPNGTYPHGLMQILDGPFDPEANMALAASMRAKRGWQPWACK